MNVYRGKHVSSQPWPVASSASYRRGRHQTKNRKRRTGFIIMGIILFLIRIYPFLEAHFLTVDKASLQSDSLPSDIGHLRIVYLSDIHYGFGFSDSDLGNLISRINQLNPDLVLFGGDYATDNLSAIRFFQQLPSIHARYAVLGIIGETDRGESAFELSHLQETMAAAGVTPLVNEVRQVRIGNSSIYVAGLDDYETGTPDVRAIASQVSVSDYVVLLSHNPSVIPDAQQTSDRDGRLGWFDLGLFGHTHGGQMRFFSSLLNIAEDVPARYRGGWLKENRVDLLISRGVGTEVIPARLLCFPQIHQIDISL